MNKLYVGGLAWAIDNNALKEAFEVHGEVIEAKVIEDRQTGRSRGFGFVTFANEEDAQKALEMNGTELQDRTIRVDFARQNENIRRNGSGFDDPEDDGRR